MLNGSAMKMASRSIDVISKKKQICTCSTLFCLSLQLFCTTTRPFCTTKTSNFPVTHYFYGGIVVCTYQRFCSVCVHVHFYFFTTAHFHLAASSSHFLTATMKFSCFPSNEIRLPRSSSVIHVSVNIKNNVEKDKNFVFFLSLKVRAAMRFSSVAIGLLYLLID